MKAKYDLGTVYVTVDAEIDPDTLRDAGWHPEGEECGPHPEPLGHAVASLHRQAHPGAVSIALCQDEPCRSLTLDQLKQVPE